MRRATLFATLLTLALPATAAEWPGGKINLKKPPTGKLAVKFAVEASENFSFKQSPLHYSGQYRENYTVWIDDMVVGGAGGFDSLADDGDAFVAEHVKVTRPSAAPSAGTIDFVQGSGLQQKIDDCMKIKGSAEQQACLMGAAMGIKSQLDERCKDPTKVDPTKRRDELCGGGSATRTEAKPTPSNPSYDEDAYRIYVGSKCRMEGSLDHYRAGITGTDIGIREFTHTVKSTSKEVLTKPSCRAEVVIGRHGTASVSLVLGSNHFKVAAQSVRVVRSTGTMVDNDPATVGTWSTVKNPVQVLKAPIASLSAFTLERTFKGEPERHLSMYNQSIDAVGQSASTTHVTFTFRMD